jgi:HD-GYP domain-containing protein (c-di-GMP phosphodiesterase class II)
MTPPFRLTDPRPTGIVPDRTTAEEFCPVDLDGLVDDTLLDFDLYLSAGAQRFVFYRSRSLPFTSRHRHRLIDNNVPMLYIRTADRQQYLQYLEHHLDQVMTNPEVTQPKKAQLLYSVSQTVMQETFEQPRSQMIVPRTRKMAARTVDFVLHNNRSLGQLARLMTTDYYTYTHSINVCVFGVTLARQLGLPDDEVKEYAVGALLHDLGKAEVDKELLTRPGPLSQEEMEAVRAHVVIGEQLLREHHSLSALAMIPVSQHHEKLDGTGYPRKIAGEDFHLFGRITAIADMFDAMTSKRSYQRAFTPLETLKMMREDMKPKFDQEILERFIKMLCVPA